MALTRSVAAKEDELAALLKEKDEEFASFQHGAMVRARPTAASHHPLAKPCL